MNIITLRNYPQLQALLWNRTNKETVEEADAFALYERNWKHIDVNTLTATELQLINELTVKYGHGVLNV